VAAVSRAKRSVECRLAPVYLKIVRPCVPSQDDSPVEVIEGNEPASAPRTGRGDARALLPVALRLAETLREVSDAADERERLALRIAVAHALGLADQLGELAEDASR
jgi:hypothetical protein